MAQNRSDTGPAAGPFLERLPGELSRWESDGIITAEQGQAIRARYSPAALSPRSVRAQGRLITGLSIIGAVLVGLGVILFFADSFS
jgi:uncharacterized membrane protein